MTLTGIILFVAACVMFAEDHPIIGVLLLFIVFHRM